MIPPTTGRRGLFAGVARVVITPPVGIRMMGYTVQDGCSESIERDLTATALVLSDGRVKVVIVACDVVFIQSPHADRIRERIGARLGVPAAHVLVNASHTHLGPMLPGWKPEPPEQHQIQERYVALLEESLVGLAGMADARLQPARIGAGHGTVPIGMNRRERLPDGRVIIGENPGGTVDRELMVIRVDDLDGRPLATLFSAGCHTVVLGPRTLSLSPDFIGPARRIVEEATGAPSLFLQGAAANVNPVCGIGGGGAEQFDDSVRLGASLAGETLKTWAAVRTHNRRGPRRVVRSVAAISVWDYEPLPVECVAFFGIAGRTLTLPLAPLPDRETAGRQLAAMRKARDESEARGDSPGARHVTQRLYEWADLVARTVAKRQPVSLDLKVWALRIDDIGIVAVNGEPFAELALEVKRRSPLAHTLFLGYSNGCLGYFPTPEAFAEGGMEVEESVRNYMLPAALTPEWGPAVVETSLELLEELNRP
jgi:neutral ceramidase